MSYSVPSSEVAADFADALQDLKVNSRPEISNLTLIAKENTEHAQAISRVLENHIGQTRPEWKLPALYVLDSIVKNVGTPYTVYLAPNLFKTFMAAYTLMDTQTRKYMEGLLKTWKQPVAESGDPRPVFPADTTREIENALIKFKTIAVQHQQQKQPQQRGMHNLPPRPMPNDPWRNTPTPPQNAPFLAAPADPRLRQNTPQQFPLPGTGPSTPVPGVAPPVGVNIELLKVLADVATVIESTKAAQPVDTQKLSILENLKTLLQGGNVTPAQLKSIKEHISSLMATPSSTPNPPPVQYPPPFPQTSTPSLTPFPPMITPLPPQPSPTPPQLPFSAPPIPSLAQPTIPFAPPTPMNLADLLRQNIPSAPPPSAPPVIAPPAPPTSTNLADLLRQFSKPAATPTPVPPIPSFAQPPAPASSGVPSSLLDALRAQNLLPNVAPPMPPPPGSMEAPGLSFPLPPFLTGQPENDVELSTASITKTSRPHLIEQLYSAMPNQCTTCGRRFPSTQQGRDMKAKHMDWHFKVKDPDIAKRGVHRSWYINEREWIDFREQDDALVVADGNAAAAGNGSKDGGKKKAAKERYIHVPTEPHLVNAPCPICQEKFDPQWSVEANDFVWMDAVKVNGKIYHASCWEEMNQGASDLLRSNTPDSILGKRKAEANLDRDFKKSYV